MNNLSKIIFNNSSKLIVETYPKILSSSSDKFWDQMKTETSYPTNNLDQKLWLFKEFGFGLCSIYSHEDSLNHIESFIENNKSINKILFTDNNTMDKFKKYFSHIDIDSSVIDYNKFKDSLEIT